MTIADTTRKAGPYDGNDVATSFAFDFKVFAAADLLVVWFDGTAEFNLVLNSDYSVTLNGDQDADPGGTITYPISGTPLATGEKLAIIGDLAYDQPLDLTPGGAFSAQTIENELDRLAMQIQQLKEAVSRALLAGATGGLPAGFTLTGVGVVDEDENTVISTRVDPTYGGVLRITNTIDGTYVELFCLSDGTLGILDSNGNGYIRLYNATFGGRVSLRCDVDGAFSVVSDDELEMFQVFQNGTVQAQGPVERTISGTTYSLLAADRGCLLNFTNAAGCAVTVPLDFLSGDLSGNVFYWRQAGAAQVTFTGAGGVTIRNKDSHTKSEALYAMGMVHQMADVNTWNLIGATGA